MPEPEIGGLPLRLIDAAVLNDVQRFHNQLGDRLGLDTSDLYAVVQVISSALAEAESVWEALQSIPGTSRVSPGAGPNNRARATGNGCDRYPTVQLPVGAGATGIP